MSADAITPDGPATEDTKHRRTPSDGPTYGSGMTDINRFPAFEDCPTASDIARWFVAEKRGEENVGGDAWWLSRNPHGSARMFAFVDYDTQEFWLLDITTAGTSDLLFVTNGLDGLWCEWWQKPTTEPDYQWHMDGVRWLADQVCVHVEGALHRG